jgi:hypothetical protein
MRACLIAAVASVALALSACTDHRPSTASSVTAPTLTGDPAHPGITSGWVDTKLYFDIGLVENAETRWHDFLDREVTPRFPDGLSVIDVHGQWQGKNQAAPEHHPTRLLIIDYPDTKENRDKIEAIRSAWKKLTGEQSVLRVTQPADVSF